MPHCKYLIFLLAFSAAHYAQAEERMQFVVQTDVEYFRWQEFARSGRLLEETGTRLGIGVAWDNFRVTTGGPLYGANARLYLGSVNYDGGVCELGTSNCEPASSDTDYFGFQIEGLGGYRFGNRRAFDLLGGVGFDYWLRSLGDITTGAGKSVSGYDEYYRILYVKLGPGLLHALETWYYRLHVGVKYPFFTEEYVTFEDGVNLSPRGRASGFAQFQAHFTRGHRFSVGIAIYYDSYRFAVSAAEPVTRNGLPVIANNAQVFLLQPESQMDVMGVQVRISFH